MIAGPLPFADAPSYASRYFQCSEPLAVERHWTIVASLRTREGAERRQVEIGAAFPDMAPEVWAPSDGAATGR